MLDTTISNESSIIELPPIEPRVVDSQDIQDGRSGKESDVWKFSVRKNNQIATCNLCNVAIKTTNGSTTGLRKHLLKTHKMAEMQPTSRKSNSKISVSLKRELHNLIVNSIVQDGRSFNDFRKPGIQKLFEKIVPGNCLLIVTSYTCLFSFLICLSDFS